MNKTAISANLSFWDKHSRLILLGTFFFLVFWGIIILSDSFLFFGANYECFNNVVFNQFCGIICGLVLFGFVLVINPKIVYRYPWIFLVISWIVILTYALLYSGSFSEIRFFKHVLRGGNIIIFSFIFYFASKIKKGNVYSKLEISAVTITLLAAHIVIVQFGDFLTDGILFLTIILCCYLSGNKKTALFVFVCVAFFYMCFLLIQPYYLAGILNCYLQKTEPYQLKQSLRCFTSGGFWGIGPAGKYLSNGDAGQLALKQMDVPGLLPDFDVGFIFSVLGLQYGLWGVVLFTVSVLVIIGMGFKAVNNASDNGSALLIFACVIILITRIFAGMGATLAITPINGEGIPLLSYSPGSVVLAFFCVSVIFINLYPKKKNSNKYSEINLRYLMISITLLFSIVPLKYLYYILIRRYGI